MYSFKSTMTLAVAALILNGCAYFDHDKSVACNRAVMIEKKSPDMANVYELISEASRGDVQIFDLDEPYYNHTVTTNTGPLTSTLQSTGISETQDVDIDVTDKRMRSYVLN